MTRMDGCLHSRAYWVSKSIIAWNVDMLDGSCYLYASKAAALSFSNSGIQGHDVEIKLEGDNDRLPVNVRYEFFHAYCYETSDGKCINATGLQLPGVLDELFSYDGPLGAVFSNDSVSVHLWAPTAQDVQALIYSDPCGVEPIDIVKLEEANGVWTSIGPRSWEGCYYVYEVSVYHPSTLQIEKCIANDPYARGLSADGNRTLLVNLESDGLKPEGWDDLAVEKPDLLSFSEISIYELHVRDFSASDDTVHPGIRSSYLAFTSQDSAGILHLKRLSAAGLTHVHLLPTFQFAGVEDEKYKWKCAVLWGVPKGSYASDPTGPSRIVEFRKMVQALNRIGLRVVLDVVYNHVHASGPFDEKSVLDKIVPGYYLRRNTDGFIEHSTCVNNTASEHVMVDGFRFDLMGHLMKRTMLAKLQEAGTPGPDTVSPPPSTMNTDSDDIQRNSIDRMRGIRWKNLPEKKMDSALVGEREKLEVKAKSMLQGLLKEKSGVDGSSIYIYGEGWDFGEVAKNGRGINAAQFNLHGTGIGSFNDRIRDALLGGSPFGHPLQQGFVTGLSLQPNGHDHGSKAATERMLAVSMDHIQAIPTHMVHDNLD
ncbi:hypothetical protein RJ640_022698 [Escallonia rubra]|uniref:Glycosyl hydrolase family 13 catalytic domain-containing protein n=1 Tax=Escallonia rubra TaxID=112253 RepID=A0AA88RQN0_9ASTE|nr:hypothetical protein RJ640_022698 [Escallonia rubra]